MYGFAHHNCVARHAVCATNQKVLLKKKTKTKKMRSIKLIELFWKCRAFAFIWTTEIEIFVTFFSLFPIHKHRSTTQHLTMHIWKNFTILLVLSLSSFNVGHGYYTSGNNVHALGNNKNEHYEWKELLFPLLLHSPFYSSAHKRRMKATTIRRIMIIIILIKYLMPQTKEVFAVSLSFLSLCCIIHHRIFSRKYSRHCPQK